MIYPNDIKVASDEWGANCGPCSLAALLECPVAWARFLIADFDKRKYMNPSHMKEALSRAGVEHHSLGRQLPAYGLAFVQWGGHGGRPHFVQYQFTHWIAIEPGPGNVIDSLPTVFEVNAPYLVSFDEWERQMPDIAKRGGLGDGTYFVRTGIEVSF